ncbi:MAG: radical SAM protein [Candidatus Riflebacteria bacterium]|nr:radical SAM protein [Candidatus Riflebacteria bacterium]
MWFSGGEPNTVPFDKWHTASLHILISRLSPYFSVSQGITHSFLYQICREFEWVYPDLAFFPPGRKDESILRSAGVPLLTGTTSKQPASEFDVIAISNSVLQEILNLPAFLEGSGIELSREARLAKKQPFILLGGSNSFVSSILHGQISDSISESGLVDGVIVGDAEYSLPVFLKAFHESKNMQPRERLLFLAAKVPGFYAPSLYSQHFGEDGKLLEIVHSEGAPFPVISSKKPHFDKKTFSGGPIFYDEDTAGISHLLVSSGCPFFCSFCKESWEQKPYREVDTASLIDTALEMKRKMGLNEINLMTFNASTFSGLDSTLQTLEKYFNRVSMKSQRFDSIAESETLLDREVSSGKKTFTCAMEGISQRIRNYLNKNLDEKTILSGFKALFSKYIRQMKVFIIVTALETESDLEELSGFLSKLKALMNALRGKPIITFSLAGLFHPPFTPLQFSPADIAYAEKLDISFSMITERIEKSGFECRVSAGSSDAALSRFIAFADRRHTKILVEASIEKGFRYYGEIEKSVYSFWKNSLQQNKLFSSFHVEHISTDTIFPWEDISTGVSKEFLFKVFQKISAFEEIQSCIASPLGSSVCQGCDACQSKENRVFLNRLSTAKIEKQPANFRNSAKAVMGNQSVSGRQSGKATRFRLECSIPIKWATTGNNFLFAALARMIMMSKPELAENFIKFESGIERAYSFGFFSADYLMMNDLQTPSSEDISAMNSYGDGIEISKIYPAREQISEKTCFLMLKISGIHQPDRHVDRILSKHAIKHLKKWKNDLLVWEISSGHSKKEGFSEISWKKDTSDIFISTHQSLAISFQREISASGICECSFLKWK